MLRSFMKFSQLIIRGEFAFGYWGLLEDDLPGPLPIGQVSFKSYLPSNKIYLPLTTELDFFHALCFILAMYEIS